jgi:hypothetical protein
MLLRFSIYPPANHVPFLITNRFVKMWNTFSNNTETIQPSIEIFPDVHSSMYVPVAHFDSDDPHVAASQLYDSYQVTPGEWARLLQPSGRGCPSAPLFSSDAVAQGTSAYAALASTQR